MTRDPSDMRRTRSQFQKQILTLCQANSLLLQRLYKIPERCYMIVRSNQQFCSLKKKLDHVTLPPERIDKGNIHSPIYLRIGRRQKISHVQTQETNAHRNHHFALLLHRDVDCGNIFTSFYSRIIFFSQYESLFLIFLLILREGISHEVFSIFSVLLRSYCFLHLDCMDDLLSQFLGPWLSKSWD